MKCLIVCKRNCAQYSLLLHFYGQATLDCVKWSSGQFHLVSMHELPQIYHIRNIRCILSHHFQSSSWWELYPAGLVWNRRSTQTGPQHPFFCFTNTGMRNTSLRVLVAWHVFFHLNLLFASCKACKSFFMRMCDKLSVHRLVFTARLDVSVQSQQEKIVRPPDIVESFMWRWRQLAQTKMTIEHVIG